MNFFLENELKCFNLPGKICRLALFKEKMTFSRKMLPGDKILF